jgi:hypothetical protein
MRPITITTSCLTLSKLLRPLLLYVQVMRQLAVDRGTLTAKVACFEGRTKRHVWQIEIKERALQRRLRLVEVFKRANP